VLVICLLSWLGCVLGCCLLVYVLFGLSWLCCCLVSVGVGVGVGMVVVLVLLVLCWCLVCGDVLGGAVMVGVCCVLLTGFVIVCVVCLLLCVGG
jgi:hypothetical protein